MTKNENAQLRYIMLSIVHLSHQDALTLDYLSDPIVSAETYTHEWIYSTGMHNGFIIRFNASSYAPGELRTKGISEALCNTIELMWRTMNVSMIHFDRNADVLMGLPVYEG